MVMTIAKPQEIPLFVMPRPGKPSYELRVKNLGASNLKFEIWQLPCVATPQIVKPVRVAGLKGRNFALIEHRVLRHLAKESIKLGGLQLTEAKTFSLDEDLAMRLGLIFRVLAPMRSRENMLACAEGIDAMGREESSYWLGMAMHRKNPRRVLAALRMLLKNT